MKTVEIIGYKRANLGKKEANDLRFSGSVPCVLYGGKDQIHFHAPAYLFKELVYTHEPNYVKLTVDGETYDCKLQDVQFHPVSEILMHCDFLLLRPGKEITMFVPVNFVGISPGVVKGGKLVQKLRNVKVKGFPENIPDSIELDISGLELGKSAKVRDIVPGEFAILNPAANPVVTVDIPRALKGQQSAE